MNTLKIQIDRGGQTELLKRGQQIVLVKMFADAGKNAVAWLAFDPFGDENSVEFESIYYIYASSQAITAGSIMKMGIHSKTAVVKGERYSFDGIDLGGGESGVPGQYGIDNQSRNDVSFGLAQKSNVNGGGWQLGSINAGRVARGLIEYFEPLETVRIFVASNIVTGQILPEGILQPVAKRSRTLVSRYLTVDFSSERTMVVHYDDETNVFSPGPLPG